MKKRLSIVSVVGCSAVAILFVLSASAQQQAPSGVNVLDIPWGQVGAMIGVVTAIFAFVQWVITVTMIQPQIRNAVTSSSADVKTWAMSEFTPKREFDIRTLKVDQSLGDTAGKIADVAHDQSKDNERIAILHDKVILNDQKLFNHDQRIVDLERRRNHSSEGERQR